MGSFPFDVVFAEAFAGSSNFLQAMRAIRLLKLVRMGKGGVAGMQSPAWILGMESQRRVRAARPAVIWPCFCRQQTGSLPVGVI